MRPSEQNQFVQLISEVMMYYKQDVSEFALGLWWQGCGDMEFETVQRALSQHAADPVTGQYPPKIADIVRAVKGVPTDRSQAAWAKVHDAMQRVGAYTDVVFDDPVIHAVLPGLGGWPTVCRFNTDELSYLQHRFCEAYGTYARLNAFPYPPVMVGNRSADQECINRGLEVPEPVLIGDKEAARKVYEQGASGGKTQISPRGLTDLKDSPESETARLKLVINQRGQGR